MNRQKIITAASVAIFSGVVSLFFVISPSTEDEGLSKVFHIRGTFFESQNYVEIHFMDSSKNTNHAVLEVLGMEESFQKTYDKTDEFIEIIPFHGSPKYGWKTQPITLVIEHNEYGTVNLKTEIHPVGEPVPPVIFSRS